MNELNRGENVTSFSPSYKRYVLGLLMVVYASNFLDRQILSILLQPIKEELALSDTQLGLLSGIAFALFYVTLGLPLARWADNHNRVTLISVSITIWSGMTALCGMANSFFYFMLARVGVGIGEAGCSPPAHSIIADYFTADKRAGAMSIYFLGLPIGAFLGLMLGGWVNELYGWRIAFLSVGLPGIILALLVKFTIKEPPRGYADGFTVTSDKAPPVKEVLLSLWQSKTFKHLAAGTSLVALTAYGSASWFPAFLMRTHNMSTGEIGTWLGLIIGLSGIFGTLLGGYLADKLGTKDDRWYAWIPGGAIGLSVPFTIMALLSSSIPLLMFLLIPVSMAQALYAPPVFSTIQRLVGLRERATASAILLFIANLIGLGIGPLLMGIVSDALNDAFGIDALRYTLLFATSFGIWAAAHFFYAAKSIKGDLNMKLNS